MPATVGTHERFKCCSNSIGNAQIGGGIAEDEADEARGQLHLDVLFTPRGFFNVHQRDGWNRASRETLPRGQQKVHSGDIHLEAVLDITIVRKETSKTNHVVVGQRNKCAE